MREKHPMDVSLLIAAALLVACGILFIYDASFVRAGQARYTGFDPQFFLKRQLLWAGVGTVALAVAMRLPYWKLDRLAVGSMAVAILLLVAVLVVGIESHGAKRALGHGMFRFQPAEFAKLALVLFLAQWLRTHGRRVRHLTEGFLPLAGLLAVVGVLIEQEPDLGTALVVVGTGVMMLFLGGARKRHLLMLLAAGALVVLVMIALKPYRGNRVTAWRDPMADPQGDSYQVVHSLIALGSGGPLGVGLGQGRQKYFYLPAEHTDYILSTIGEELGLVGTLGILLLFFFVAMRGFDIAHNTRDPFGSLVASGLSSMIALQAILNIGVVTNVLPATGVPLPFISYGGSSLVLTMFAMGLLVNISQYPSGAPQASREGRRRDEVSADRGWDRRARVSGHRYR
ncbi:MAG: putative lipid II flippase FtsW [Armatimonadetes bacterium]|nr:putative lipid II flippase FtsW [Armatimonadota bacterium]